MGDKWATRVPLSPAVGGSDCKQQAPMQNRSCSTPNDCRCTRAVQLQLYNCTAYSRTAAAALSEHECSAPLIECGYKVRSCTCMCSLALSRNPPPALRTAVCTAASRGDLTALDGGAQLVGGHSVAYGRANTGRRWTMDSGGAGPCLLRLCLSIRRGVQCKTGERREGDEAGQAARGSREKGARQCSRKQSSIGVQL